MACQQALTSSLWGTDCWQLCKLSPSSFTRFTAISKTRRPLQLVVLARKRSGFAEILFNRRLAEKEKTLLSSKRPRLKRGMVSPRLPVPDHIPRPPYVNSIHVPDFSKLPQIHDSHGIECMRASGRLAAEVLDYAGTLVKVMIVGEKLDCEETEEILETEVLQPEQMLAHKERRVKKKLVGLEIFGEVQDLDAKWMEDIAESPHLLELYLTAFGLALTL
ncbi:hypothetical protein L7F22_053333 [Adiantum nelumboides]|nr:hypothetical protein [Adiantum nelumboides]